MKIIKNLKANENKKRMYGYDMKDSVSSYVSANLNSPKQIGRLEITELEICKSENSFDLFRIKYIDGGKLKESIEKSLYQRSDEEIKRENLLLSTYKDVARRNDLKEIKCADFLDEIKERLKSDIRYGYKEFYLETKQNSRHSVYIYQIYAIIIATLSIYNEIDFKRPIKLSFIMDKNDLILKINMNIGGIDKRATEAEILKESINEARKVYLEALCKNKGTFALMGETLSLELLVDEAPKDEYKLFSKASEESLFFEKYMDIFNASIDITEEAEEEV